MLGSVIGAGILGIPYAVVKVGWAIGVFYIIALGLLVMGLNLMLGEITLRTKQPMQIVGFAGKYLGEKGKIFMAVVSSFSLFGALLAYLIGEGAILSGLFGGSAFFWSLIFWVIGAALVFFGLSLVKKIDVFLSLIILTIILVLAFISAPEIKLPHLSTVSFSNFFLPFGVILFALQGASAIPQAHELLPHEQKRLRTVIITASSIIIVAYIFFTTVVLGVTGAETTEVATLGLGSKLGRGVFVLVNVFAAFVMGTAFVNLSLAIKRIFIWDYKIPRFAAWLLTALIPLVLFLIGFRNFIDTIDFVGAIFGSITAIIIIAIYWRAKSRGDLFPHSYGLRHSLLLSVLVIIVFLIASIYSIIGRL